MEKDLFTYITQQEHSAKAFGFYWESLEQLIEQIQSECVEIRHAKDPDHLLEEVGDLLNAAVSLAIFLQLDPKEALAKSVAKVDKRYRCLVDLVHQEGLADLQGKDTECLLTYWERAKAQVG